MTKFKRVWKREGESDESYEKRLEEAYNEMLQTEEGQRELKWLEEQIHNVYKTMERNIMARRCKTHQ